MSIELSAKLFSNPATRAIGSYQVACTEFFYFTFFLQFTLDQLTSLMELNQLSASLHFNAKSGKLFAKQSFGFRLRQS